MEGSVKDRKKAGALSFPRYTSFFLATNVDLSIYIYISRFRVLPYSRDSFIERNLRENEIPAVVLPFVALARPKFHRKHHSRLAACICALRKTHLSVRVPPAVRRVLR